MTDQRKDSCMLCMLIPLILGLIGLSALYWWAKESRAEFIENDLSIKSNSLLSDQQVGGVIVNMDGRDAILTGTVETEERSQEIETIIASLAGIRIVDNQLEIISKPIIEAKPIEEAEIAEQPQPMSEIAEDPQPQVALVQEPEQILTEEEAVEGLLQTLDLSGITFLFGSDEITAEGIVILNDVVRILNQHPEFDIAIEGHTDNTGDKNLNLELSQQRAASVMNYLISQGIQSERLNATGYGESKPIASNDTAEGRATNRRIDFEVTRRQ